MAIFKKADDYDRRESDDNDGSDMTPAPRFDQPRPAVRSNSVSVIGPTLVFKGELTADEDLIIEGQIEGTIAHHNKHLTVGEKGRVKADIHASSVIVLGQLVGDIHSEGMVSLAKGSDVRGNISCARIVMADGARFKGKIDMGEPPKVKAMPKGPEKSEPDQAKKPRIVGGKSANSSVY